MTDLNQTLPLAQDSVTVTKAMLRTALIRADTGGYSTLGVKQLEEAERAVNEDTERLYRELKALEGV